MTGRRTGKDMPLRRVEEALRRGRDGGQRPPRRRAPAPDDGDRSSLTVRRFHVDGIVQGVGFRPFVYRTASALGLNGWVANVNGHVEGEVAGERGVIDEFAQRLRADAPALARVRHVRLTPGAREAVPSGGFQVRHSAPGPANGTAREIPPDAGICDACLRELRDPCDRRHRYPFINCTDCGPRATIIEDLPYDRTRTTMRRFPLCARCAAEYADPGDRRFHAEPVACPACGPRLAWEELRGEEALRSAVRTVAGGGIVALKGLGGYQLVCDAGDSRAVAELRRRKRRPTKPFAVMVRDMGAAAQLARISGTEQDVLTSAARPVVLLSRCRRHGEPLADGVHPGLGRVGLFLPTTGLHQLLLDDLDRPLVVTSGNLVDEPLMIEDAEARKALVHIADGFLTHDRPIRARYDDSVVQVTGRVRVTVRRARGLAPAPLSLDVREAIAGAGGQLKHTFTLAADGRAHLGPHTGDLADVATYEAFQASYDDLKRLTGIEPTVIAHDLHPGYLSTRWAREQAVRLVAVQHHHAHVVAWRPSTGCADPSSASPTTVWGWVRTAPCGAARSWSPIDAATAARAGSRPRPCPAATRPYAIPPAPPSDICWARSTWVRRGPTPG
ncbi:carbamoyltransferase HypF [Streptomyces brasiliscabiei]|uniref:acylphosphatase n=1 Tax=Streptomyces brasiliscabiei TaxID=2736302 RepID=A0ABU8GCL6_9ACTN